ncbi:Uncharacterized protein CXorf59 [Gryllus bimaculatus]|nr:Uncharacterized protein CXorf59 [Gryllus bimaculatus]
MGLAAPGVLLLSGTMQATRFGRSLALRLEGQPSSIAVSATVLIQAPLYKPTQHTIKLPLPYSSFFNADQLHDFPEFDLYLTESMPSVEEPFSGCAWSELQSRKELRRLFLNQTTAKVEMVAAEPKKKPYHLRRSATRTHKVTQERVPTSKLSVTMCAFTPHVRDYWIGCVSPKVGDFIIKCTCGGRFYGADALVPCPLITHVKVPCTNPALRTAANCMFMKTLNEYEMEFWQEHLESSVGLRLMQLELVKDEHITDEYAHIFNTNVVYSVEILKNDYLTAPVQLHIPDVLSGDHVPLLLHVNNATSSFMQWRLQLSSADGRELRTYTLQAVLPLGEEEALEAQSSVEAIPGSFRTRSQLYSELIRQRMKLLSRSSRRSSYIRRSKKSEKSITSQTLQTNKTSETTRTTCQTNKTCETARTSQTDRSSRASRTSKAIVTSQTDQTHRTRWKCTTNGASRSRRSSRALHPSTGSQSLCRKSDCSCASRLCPQNRAGEPKK